MLWAEGVLQNLPSLRALPVLWFAPDVIARAGLLVECEIYLKLLYYGTEVAKFDSFNRANADRT